MSVQYTCKQFQGHPLQSIIFAIQSLSCWDKEPITSKKAMIANVKTCENMWKPYLFFSSIFPFLSMIHHVYSNHQKTHDFRKKNCLWLSLAPLQEVRRSSYSDSCAVRPDRRSFNVLRHAWTWHGHVAKELKKTGRILSTKEVGPVEKHPVFSTSVKILPALPPSRVQSRPGLLLHPLPKAARAKNVRASCDQRPWLRSWWQHFLSPVWRGKKVLVDDGWFVFLLACWPVLCILGIFGDFPNPWTQTFHILYQPTILWHCSDGSVASAGSQWWTATNATGNLINRAAKNVEIIAYPQLKGYKSAHTALAVKACLLGGKTATLNAQWHLLI